VKVHHERLRRAGYLAGKKKLERGIYNLSCEYLSQTGAYEITAACITYVPNKQPKKTVHFS
jgi:hypothetical protein